MSAPPDEGTHPRIGQFRIVDFVGEGGVGAVYLGVDDFTHRRVAVKVLLPKHLGDPMLHMRFRQEARFGAQLKHPHIADVLTGGVIRRVASVTEASASSTAPTLYGQELPEGSPYFVMEFLEGSTLSGHIHNHGPLPYAEVPSRLGPLFDAMAYLHARGVVHRDLKPGNIHFGATLKVLDLGSAKADDEALETFGGVEKTTGENVPFTTAFLCPESIRDAATYDRHGDLWALACTLYQAVTLRLPFGSGTRRELLPALCQRITEGRYEPLREIDPDVPPAVVGFFARAFALPREDRFQSVEEMHAAVNEAFGASPAPVAGHDVVAEGPAITVPRATPPPQPSSDAPVSPTVDLSVTVRPTVVNTATPSARIRWGIAAGVVVVAALTYITARSLTAPTERRARGPDVAAIPVQDAVVQDSPALAPADVPHDTNPRDAIDATVPDVLHRAPAHRDAGRPERAIFPGPRDASTPAAPPPALRPPPTPASPTTLQRDDDPCNVPDPPC